MKLRCIHAVAGVLLCSMPQLWAGEAAKVLATEPEGWIDRIDLERLVPPWPARNSQLEKDELAEIHRVQTRATAAEKALAKQDDVTYGPAIFSAVLGPKFDLAKLPKTKLVMNRAMDVDRPDSSAAKKYFRRPRPWIADPTIQTCNPHDSVEPLTAYPSGHAMEVFILGVVLANLIPEKAQAILARASQYSEARILCGFHYRSDITAGQQYGSILAVEMLHHPRFLGWVNEARAELINAGLITK